MTADPLSNPTIKSSELLQVSFDDLKKCEADPAYRVRMSYWHNPEVDVWIDGELMHEPCEVCLAGSVLAQTYNQDRRIYTDPDEVGAKYGMLARSRVIAINYFRTGEFRQALSHMRLLPENSDTRPLIERAAEALYEATGDMTNFYTSKDRTSFHAYIETIIRVLKEHNL